MNEMAKLLSQYQGKDNGNSISAGTTIKFDTDSLNLNIEELAELKGSIEELTEAIKTKDKKNKNLPINIDYENNTFKLIISILAIILIIAAFAIPREFFKMKLASTITATITGSLAMTLNVLSIENMGFEFSFPVDTTSSVKYDIIYEYSERIIYPFYTGSTQLSEIAIKRQNELINELEHKKDEIKAIYLSGGFDKRELKDKLINIYGSNIGLAQARVNAVKDNICNQLKIEPKKVIPLIKGPEIHNLPNDEKRLAKDRSVTVVVEYFTKKE